MLRNYLPTFHQLEPQNLKGLYGGDVVAQRPVAYASAVYGVPTVQVGSVYFIENGILCGLNDEAKVVSFDDSDNVSAHPMVHFTEELPTILEANSTFAVLAKEDETYLRLIVLHTGDEFVTDNVDATDEGPYAKIDNGVVTLQSTANSDTMFAVMEDTLPDGTPAYRCIYLG